MAQLRFKWLLFFSGVLLFGCEQSLSGGATLAVPIMSCPQFEVEVLKCVEKKTFQNSDVVKMFSVVNEQLKIATIVEQQKICRDITLFWQAACGVAQ